MRDAQLVRRLQAQTQEKVQRAKRMTEFSVEKVENGYVLGYNHKSWVVVDPKELADQIVAIFVSEELE